MKPILRKNEKGIAMLIAIMVLSLGGSIALIAFRSSTAELTLSRFAEHEVNSQYLAESGVDQVISWILEPASFPNSYSDFVTVRSFFEALPSTPCNDDDDLKKLTINNASFLADPHGPFSELKTAGNITEIKLYAPVDQSDPPADGDTRLCTLEVSAVSGSGARKTIRVDLAQSAIGPITAGIQGLVSSNTELPLWTHWGEIHYAADEDGITPDANLGTSILRVPNLDNIPPLNFNRPPYDGDPGHYPLNIDPMIVIRVEDNIGPLIPDDGDSFSDRSNVVQQDSSAALNITNPDDPHQVALRRFLRANGELYTVSSEAGKLEKNGHIIGTFDEIFGIPHDDEHPPYRLAWISMSPHSSTAALPIEGGRYKGYFFFSGDINIQGGHPGREIDARPPEGDAVELDNINLEGLFYSSGLMTIQDSFKTYGAFFSRGGFTGAGTQDLEVWYNSAFHDAVFPGIRSVSPLSGTWATLASDHP